MEWTRCLLIHATAANAVSGSRTSHAQIRPRPSAPTNPLSFYDFSSGTGVEMEMIAGRLRRPIAPIRFVITSNANARECASHGGNLIFGKCFYDKSRILIWNGTGSQILGPAISVKAHNPMSAPQA